MELYVSDLDGTLLNSQQKLSKNTIRIINNLIEEQGLKFTIATARSINSSKEFIDQLNLKYPIILSNGVFVYDPVLNRYLTENCIEYDTILEIIKILESFKLNPIVYTITSLNERKIYYKGIFNFGEKDYIQRKLDKDDKRFSIIRKFSEIFEQKIIKVLIIDKKETVEKVYNILKEQYLYYFHFTEDIYSKFYWLEITNVNATKKQGVNFIKSHLNVSKVISFGDNLNDLPMFEASDEKYAVSNAKEELKKCSTEIIESNDNDGVAMFLYNKYSKQNRCLIAS